VEGVKIDFKKISAVWIGEIKVHGGMLYIPVPKRTAEYHDLRVGDEVRVEVKERKRKRVE